MIVLGACGGGEGEGEVSAAELSSGLPAAGELAVAPKERQTSDSDEAAELFTGSTGLVIGAETNPSELAAAIEEAGFQRVVGTDFGGGDVNVRIRAIQLDSAEGALEVRGLLHDEDLKSPCPKACIVTPIEYELDDVSDSVAVHHVPTQVDLPGPGVEAHHAGFVIGSRLYVVQMDGQPSPTFSADFDELMRTVYESASGAQ